MNDTSPADPVIKTFVRERLGCACPDEVFNTIRIIEGSRVFDTDSTVYEIGGRLLVVILTPEDWHQIIPGLEPLLRAGRVLRDQKGFNRLRLVVATPDRKADDVLQARFNACLDNDNRIHLHVIHPHALPSHGPIST